MKLKDTPVLPEVQGTMVPGQQVVGGCNAGTALGSTWSWLSSLSALKERTRVRQRDLGGLER